MFAKSVAFILFVLSLNRRIFLISTSISQFLFFERSLQFIINVEMETLFSCTLFDQNC